MMMVGAFLGFRNWVSKISEKRNQRKAVKEFISAKASFFDFVQAYDGDKAGMFSGFGLTRDPRFIDYQR